MNEITVVMSPRKRNEKQFKSVLINVEKFLPFEINFDGAECWLSRKIFVLYNFLFWYLKGVDGWGADLCKSKRIREEVFCKHITGQEIIPAYWNRKQKRINRNSTKKVNTFPIWNRFFNMQICWRDNYCFDKTADFQEMWEQTLLLWNRWPLWWSVSGVRV